MHSLSKQVFPPADIVLCNYSWMLCFIDHLCANFIEIMFSTSWLHACFSLNKQEYCGFLKDMSIPSLHPSFLHMFYSDILALSFVKSNCHFTLSSKPSRINTKAQGETLVHIQSLTTMLCNCVLVHSPDMNFKWSRVSGRMEIFPSQKLLGITILPTWAQTPEELLIE